MVRAPATAFAVAVGSKDRPDQQTLQRGDWTQWCSGRRWQWSVARSPESSEMDRISQGLAAPFPMNRRVYSGGPSLGIVVGCMWDFWTWWLGRRCPRLAGWSLERWEHGGYLLKPVDSTATRGTWMWRGKWVLRLELCGTDGGGSNWPNDSSQSWWRVAVLVGVLLWQRTSRPNFREHWGRD